MYGVKYYIIADSEKNSIEIFELVDNQYKQTDTTHFKLTPTCSFEFNSFGLFD
jgi:Uma2 family endonuclease